jgi:diacylglycerol kinase (ATP)
VAATLFVVNPAARGGAGAKLWPQIAAEARRLGLGDEHAFTEGPGHATALVRDAIGRGVERIVAVGGDGTSNEVVNGFFAEDGTPLADGSALGLVAIGTGRDTIRTYGIPKKPKRALAVLADGTTRRVDVGRATFATADGGTGSRMFLNVGSCGLTGAVADRANRTSNRFGGTATFLYATVTTFVAWKNRRFHVELDGEPRDQLANNVIVANGRAFGGGIRIAPDAEPDDGLFDVLIWGDVGKLDLALNLPRLYRGTHLGHPKLDLGRRRSVLVEPETPMPIELDGELPGTTPVRFEIVPASLTVCVPASKS